MLERPETANPWGETESPYIEIGGEDGVRNLSNIFYDTIDAESPILKEMLPRNTTKTREKFYMYLSGWMGGPPLYMMKWGHPRLRQRHFPFSIGEFEAEEWMRCMKMAISRAGVDDPLKTFLETRFQDVALHMRNQ